MKWQRIWIGIVGVDAGRVVLFSAQGAEAAGVRGRASSSRSATRRCRAAAVPASEHMYSADFAPFQNCASPGGSIGLVDPTAERDTTFGALYVCIPATPGGFVESETITAVAVGARSLGYSHINENGFPGPEPEETRIFPRAKRTGVLFGWNGGCARNL